MQLTCEVMGTVFTVRVDDDIEETALEAASAWWSDVEDRFSTFKPESQVARIGRGQLAEDEADADVRHALSVCAEIEAASGGRFSIRPGRPGGPGVDPAGYVKGWSVDEVAIMLRLAGATNFVIYAGGDVLCSGHPFDDTVWRVGIRNPADPDQLTALVRLERGAVATSAAYERGDHIWGPAPGQDILSASVVGPSLGIADALATALFADGARSLDWMGAFPGYGALIVASDGSMRCSESLTGQVDGVAFRE